MTLKDRLTRRVMPRIVVALSTVRWPGRLAAAVRRALGRRGRVELFVAFDDPYSAVAVLGLVDRIAKRKVTLEVEPVVQRGIPDDPAVEAKRRYAVVDARRLAARASLQLARSEPLQPETTSFLAEWAASAPEGPQRTAFCAAAMRRLWFTSDEPVSRAPYEALWREYLGSAPPATADATEVEKFEQRMKRRRLYDTPVAVVHGQWFFAHERLDQIGFRLDELGWVKA